MARIIVLDSFPLSCVGKAPSSQLTLTERCRQWATSCIAAGNSLYVPAIAYYEVLRELERLRASSQIVRLKKFCHFYPERFIILETEHLENAARMWAEMRNTGRPTASAEALDGDVILAAQTLGLGLPTSDFVIATTNVNHLARFVPAEHWASIDPGS